MFKQEWKKGWLWRRGQHQVLTCFLILFSPLRFTMNINRFR